MIHLLLSFTMSLIINVEQKSIVVQNESSCSRTSYGKKSPFTMGYDKNYIQLVYDDFNIWSANRNGKNHLRKNNSSDSIGQNA